jgi:carbonic anhydrase/acetyltransferase-like protein (isoleucine patch superfamily)
LDFLIVPIGVSAICAMPSFLNHSFYCFFSNSFHRIPSGQVWSGNPATYLRDADEDEAAMITKTADAYADVADKHATEFLPYGTAYVDEGTYVDPYAVEAK